MKLLALAATLIVCATPVLAQDLPRDTGCDDPGTTGSLAVDTRGIAGLHAHSGRIAATPPEESWQAEARDDAEQRRREWAEGCPGS